ncbi:heat shock protein 22 [Blastocystis sp. ATCC 50177/Nand II]|uniref:Heat shock protein 22 n=1 Tax=Blastocystis sp. subtype 1 (strain ATCC 50177 / NandII) TaxID=478820 RepID=A0A196S707_BLAHN|nr:heat shock protein 22 [Blastocystis sp. ATCC 50177/Nand II]
MSIANYARNSFFDNDDYAFNAVPKARVEYNEVNPNVYPLQVDLIDANDFYVLIADVPGVSRDRLTVSVKENKLYIEGKRKRKVVSGDDSYLIANRRNGVFKRLVNLPLDSDPQSMTAKLEDGLLVLTIPRVKKVNGLKYVTIA